MTWPAPLTVVVDGTRDEVAVWIVMTGRLLEARESRFTAAWVVHAAAVDALQVWRADTPVLATDRGLGYLPEHYLDEAAVVHGTQLMEALVSRIRVLNTAFDIEHTRTPGARSLTSPVWPDIEHLGLPTESPARMESPRDLAFRNALWLARFANAWEAVEEQRDAQPYLRDVALVS